jgi:uncharacterized membrane protein
MRAPSTLSQRLLRYFVHGILIIAPLTLTVVVLRWLFQQVDGLLQPYVTVPGLGFVIVLASVLLVGWIGSFFLMRRLFVLFDRWLEYTPGVSFIYSSIRDFFDAFIGEKRRFTKAVLVNVFADEVWLVGFLTDEDLANFNLGATYVSVYVPQAYNVAGQLYLVQRERVRSIEHLPSADVMKYAVSGGAVDIVVPPVKTPPPGA